MEAKLKCPRCKVYMQKLKKKDVIIDVCGKCGGMWLDAGEMEKLAEMARGEQIDKK
ncbi:MAG: zf-TFIIB domain-containing protein [Nanoarchaeota archaeon]